jgi:cell division GTPase FtsZ
MRVLWIGYGQAGGKIANTMMATSRRLYEAIAINTEGADLGGLSHIREKVLIGRYALKGRGVGANIELGANIAEKALSQMMDRIDLLVRKFDPEAFWIAAGLAGGTGAGGSHVLANELNRVYRGTPVYGLGVLPTTTGMPSEKEALNLSNALKSFELWNHYFNNILLVDNGQFEDNLVTRESVEHMYQRANNKLAVTLTTLLNAGEVRPAPQEVFSSSEIKATLGMIGDVSTIGFCAEPIKLKSRFWQQGIDPGTHELESIIERSVAENSLTFPCDVSGARSVALVVKGRPEHLFTQAISTGRSRLEQATTVGKVRYGDYPDRSCKYLSAITVVSGISDFSRLEQMKKRVAELTWNTPSTPQPSTDGVPASSVV